MKWLQTDFWCLQGWNLFNYLWFMSCTLSCFIHAGPKAWTLWHTYIYIYICVYIYHIYNIYIYIIYFIHISVFGRCFFVTVPSCCLRKNGVLKKGRCSFPRNQSSVLGSQCFFERNQSSFLGFFFYRNLPRISHSSNFGWSVFVVVHGFLKWRACFLFWKLPKQNCCHFQVPGRSLSGSRFL